MGEEYQGLWGEEYQGVWGEEYQGLWGRSIRVWDKQRSIGGGEEEYQGVWVWDGGVEGVQ